MTGARAARGGIVALLAAYAVFAWPGLYHLAHNVLAIRETIHLHGHALQRAWLFPASIDGGIFVAGVILLTHPDLAPRLRDELWHGMWTIAGLSGLGLVVDELARLLGFGFPPAAAIPLVLAPVGIATWFLHLVVRATGSRVLEPDAAPAWPSGDASPPGQDWEPELEEPEPTTYEQSLGRGLDWEMARLTAVPPLPADLPERTHPAAAPTPARVHAKVRTGKSQATGPCRGDGWTCPHHTGAVSKSTRYKCAPGGDCRTCHPKEAAT